MVECCHDFQEFEDWEGDPSIPDGVHTFVEVKCIHCGEAPEEEDPREYTCPICLAPNDEYTTCGCYADIHYGKD